MKTKPIPAIVMLVAGFVTCIMSIRYHLELKVFTKTLLLVLVVFYLLGIVVKIILDKNFPQMSKEEQEETTEEQTQEGQEGQEQETAEPSEEEEKPEEGEEPEAEENDN